MRNQLLLLLLVISLRSNSQEINEQKHKLTTSYQYGALAYARDMTYLGITYNTKLMLYNPATFALSRTLTSNRKGNIVSFSFSQDGKSVVIFSTGKSILKMDINNGAITEEILLDEAPVSGTWLDGDNVAFITEKKLYGYHLTSKSKLFEVQAHAKPVRSIAASIENNLLVTGGGDGKLIFL